MAYAHNWSSFEDMKEDFLDYEQKPDQKDWDGVNILFASYGYGSYCGDAFVLFERGGYLFEVNASHCSCHGLEGQWSPEPTTKASLLLRLNEGDLGSDDYTDNVFADLIRPIVEALP